jgi:hypothetical protein
MPHPVTASPHPAVALLKDLVRFPSLSREEGPVADFVEDYVRRAGLPVERFEDNVFFRLGEGQDRLLLNSHLDVVAPSNDHPYDPFDPVEIDGRLYGRGTVDAKASGAAMTTAVLDLAAEGWTPPNGQVLVALTACEELGGTYNGLQNLRPHLPPLNAAPSMPTARPVKALSSEITTGMSAPPIGLVTTTPSARASTKKATMLKEPGCAEDTMPMPSSSVTAASPTLTLFCCGRR